MKRLVASRTDQARARSRLARSAGSPCVGSTSSTGLSNSGLNPAATSSTVTPSGSQPAGISSPSPRSISVSRRSARESARSRARGRAGPHGRDTPPSRTASRRSRSASPGRAGPRGDRAPAHTGKPSDAASRSCQVEVRTVTTSRDPNSARTSSGTAIGSIRISRSPSSIAYARHRPLALGMRRGPVVHALGKHRPDVKHTNSSARNAGRSRGRCFVTDPVGRLGPQQGLHCSCAYSERKRRPE
jgi:hypothetical protein